jgi:hypothetical protein
MTSRVGSVVGVIGLVILYKRNMVFARRASNGNNYAPAFFYEMIFKRRCVPGQEVACLQAAADISKTKSLALPLKTE